MNLVPVTQIRGSELIFRCCKCTIGFVKWGFADLDGEPWRAYYCRVCAEVVSGIRATDPAVSVYSSLVLQVLNDYRRSTS